MKRVAPMVFENRTAFPVSAGCVIANGVRDTLSSLLGKAIDMRLFAPIVPSAQAWDAITSGAQLFTVRGPRADVAIVLRAEDSVRLCAAAFGETASTARALSAVESTVLERIVRALCPNFAAVCGSRPDALVPQRVPKIVGYSTYMELLVERPFAIDIGIALARSGGVESPGAVRPDDLLDLEVDVAVRTTGVHMTGSELGAVEVGTIVPITLTTRLTAVAAIAGRPVASGECGVRGNRLALAIGGVPCTEGSSEPEP